MQRTDVATLGPDESHFLDLLVGSPLLGETPLLFLTFRAELPQEKPQGVREMIGRPYRADELLSRVHGLTGTLRDSG